MAAVALVVGSGFAIFETAKAIDEDRAQSAAAMRHLADVASIAVGYAAQSGDEGALSSVTGAIGATGIVSSARILAADGHELAGWSATPPEVPPAWQQRLYGWLAGEVIEVRLGLTLPQHSNGASATDTKGRPATIALVEASWQLPILLLEKIWAVARHEMIEALLIGVLLSLIFQNFVTRPIVRIGEEIRALPDALDVLRRISLPKNHVTDELGHLVKGMNGLLARLADSQEEIDRLSKQRPSEDVPARELLLAALGQLVERAEAAGHRVAVVSLDIDRFNQIIDALGHDVGMELLSTVNERLKSVVRESDLLVPVGSDRFVVLLDDAGSDEDIAQAANRLHACLIPPFQIRDHRLHISVSLGIAIYPQNSSSSQELLRQADTAMHKVKRAGGNTLKFFNDGMARKAAVRFNFEGMLREAVDGNEFELFLQPKIDSRSGKVRGAEALIRWRRDGKYVPPAEFIPIAERSGLIIPIGDWVFAEACRLASRLRNRPAGFHIAVNVSARQLDDAGFLARVTAMVHTYGIRPGDIEIEITETAVMTRFEHYNRQLLELRSLGFRIAIDDFGTGYSNLAYLKQLPVDVLKIDGSFIRSLPGDMVIAAMVIGLAEQLSLETVAECVETVEQASWLTGSGCNYLQGYLFSPAVPVAEFERKFLDPAAAEQPRA